MTRAPEAWWTCSRNLMMRTREGTVTSRSFQSERPRRGRPNVWPWKQVPFGDDKLKMLMEWGWWKRQPGWIPQKSPLRTPPYMLHIVSGTHAILGQLPILFGWRKHTHTHIYIYMYTHIYNDCSIDIKYIPSSLWSYSHIPHHSGSTGDLRCSLLLSQISSEAARTASSYRPGVGLESQAANPGILEHPIGS